MREQISRHKTAISRSDFSRPIRLAISDGLLTPERALFDYGCGLGDDLRLLATCGFVATGWDPVHRPNEPQTPTQVVNLGYVVNVIEKPIERQEVLRRAWGLTRELLVVSARVTMDRRALGDSTEFSDGLLTSIGTFQKFFDQQELRNWIDSTLTVSSVPAAPGIFYVFRNDEERAAFLASRYRRRVLAPSVMRSEDLFKQHEQLLSPLMEFVGERGRLPADEELSNAQSVREVFGTLRRAFRVVLRVTDEERWDDVARQRAEDLLIYLALARFDARPQYRKLPVSLQRDVKEFFSTYHAACDEADEVLLSLGKAGVVELACKASKIGKAMPEALYIHESARDSLSTILRLYEGCARGYIGRIESANVIKLHRTVPRVSYLTYANFWDDPHPVLSSVLTVHLQTFHVESRDYSQYKNPPILHRKELFLTDAHPLRGKFARLTRIEEAKGLYEDPSRIGTRDAWASLVAKKRLRYAGHRLLRDG